MRPPVPVWLVHVLLLAAMVSIGAGFVATKVIMGHLPALTWVGIRIAATASVLLAAFGRRLAKARLTLRDHATLAGCALLGIVANQACFALGLRHTTPAHASLINGLVPLLTLLIAAAASMEQLNGRKLAAIALALPGLALLMNLDQAGWSLATGLGDGLVLVNSVCYALYLVVSRSVFRRLGWQVAVTGMFLWATPVMAIFGLAQAQSVIWTAIPSQVWLLMAFVILGPSVGAYITNAWALQRLDASRVALYGYVPPLAAVILAVVLLAESVTARLLVSMGLIFTGVGVTLVPTAVLAVPSQMLGRLQEAIVRRLQPVTEAPASLSPVGQ